MSTTWADLEPVYFDTRVVDVALQAEIGELYALVGYQRIASAVGVVSLRTGAVVALDGWYTIGGAFRAPAVTARPLITHVADTRAQEEAVFVANRCWFGNELHACMWGVDLLDFGRYADGLVTFHGAEHGVAFDAEASIIGLWPLQTSKRPPAPSEVPAVVNPGGGSLVAGAALLIPWAESEESLTVFADRVSEVDVAASIEEFADGEGYPDPLQCRALHAAV